MSTPSIFQPFPGNGKFIAHHRLKTNPQPGSARGRNPLQRLRRRPGPPSLQPKRRLSGPSACKRGQRLISVPFWIAGKLAVYQAIQEAGITNVELAKRLGVTEAIVRRILDPDHETKDRKLAAALAVLGKELVMAVVPRKVA